MRLVCWVVGAFGAFAVAVAAAACSSAEQGAVPNGAKANDAGPEGAVRDGSPTDSNAAVDRAKNTDVGTCASEFGSALTPGFGRLDGKLVAIVRPQDQSCSMPNRDHVIVQVEMEGAVYRMVVNVESDRGSDARVRFGAFAGALPEPAFAEGWHTGVAFDYADFGARADEGFDPLEKDALVDAIVGELRIGENISVYATNGAGRPESAHLVHRNADNADGAVVIAPESSSAKFLLFHFADQSF